jgi:hypothetical protein
LAGHEVVAALSSARISFWRHAPQPVRLHPQ